MSDPLLPLEVWQSGTNENSIPANDNALRNEAITRRVISKSVTAQPVSPADGDTYIIASTHTGSQWSTFSPNDITIYRGGTWYAWAPVHGMPLVVGSVLEYFNGTNWVGVSAPGTTVLAPICVACSDEITALTTGTAKVTFRMPYAFTVTAVKASLTTAQTSGAIFTVDINEAGVSILSTKITIDNTEKTSVTAATPPVISDTSLAADAEMTIDIDTVGSGTAAGLKVWIIGYAT